MMKLYRYKMHPNRYITENRFLISRRGNLYVGEGRGGQNRKIQSHRATVPPLRVDPLRF